MENSSQLSYDLQTCISVFWKPLRALSTVTGFSSFSRHCRQILRESSCTSYQRTAEALEEQQSMLTSRDKGSDYNELKCLKHHVCTSLNSSTEYYITLKQIISDITTRYLTYPSHCNAIDKCHIWLLASACKKCKKIYFFFKRLNLWLTVYLTHFPMSYFSKSNRK